MPDDAHGQKACGAVHGVRNEERIMFTNEKVWDILQRSRSHAWKVTVLLEWDHAEAQSVHSVLYL